MLLDAIIIILRETLEASVLTSVFLSIVNQSRATYKWLWSGLVFGMIGAFFYAENTTAVSEWLDYAGQEIVNASLQYTIYICIAFIALALLPSNKTISTKTHLLMGFAVALAITREGSEIIIFISGLLQSDEMLTTAITSCFVGLMIGLSVGGISYYLIQSVTLPTVKKIQFCLLSLIGAGMCAQASQLLIQADWLPSKMPLWNSEWLITESSIMGQIAYAVFGYESTPSSIEVIIYVTALMIIPMSAFIQSKLKYQND